MSGIESCGPVTALTLGLPSTTAVMHPRGRLAKERFYTNTKVGKRLRQHFIEDIDSITMLAVIREQETGIPAGPFTNEINVIGLEQSTEHPPLEVMEHIARTRDELTHHRSRILFVCVNGSMTKFAVFRNANRGRRAHGGLGSYGRTGGMRIRTHSSERNQSGHRMGVVVRGDHPQLGRIRRASTDASCPARA